MAEPNNITIKGRDSARDAGIAGGAITPGYLITLNGKNGEARQFVAGTSSSAVKVGMSIAVSGLGGKGIDDDYASGESLRHKTFLPGDEFYGFVFAGASASGTAPDTSANANLAVGDKVVSYGNGTFRKFSSSNDSQGAVLARATEAVDNSGGSSPARVIFEVV